VFAVSVAYPGDARSKEDGMQAKDLIAGLTVKTRPDGTVITVKSPDGRATVAEVCVGTKKTRVNFRETPKSALAKSLTGKSKSWPGGGVVVDEKNAAVVRAALLAATKPEAAKPKRSRSKKVAAAA
jgi:hypothetical protein